MKSKLLFSKLFLVFVLSLNTFSYTQNYIVNENFESTALGSVPSDWSVTHSGGGTANQVVVDNPVKNGNHAFQLSAANNIASLRKTVSNLPDKVTLEGWLFADSILGGLSGAIGLTNSSTDVGFGLINGNFTAVLWQGTTQDIVIRPYVENTWYHVMLEYNLSSLTYQVFIDGEIATANDNGTIIDTFSFPNVQLDKIYLNSGNSGTINLYFDDIKLYDTPGLIAYYPFNGNANDESGNDYHGSVYGATLTTDRNGNANSAYEFNGIDNYVDIGDWENGGPMSFTFWARWDAYNWYSRILDLGNGSSSNNIIVGNYRDENSLFFSCYNGSTETKMWTPTISLGQWDFYAATVDANGIMTVYKNGQQIDQKTDGSTPNTMLRTEQFIGRSNFSADDYFEGAIDELKIYDYALTLEEIQSNYNNNLIAYYPFNGNAYDESGYDNHGTVSGATLTTDRFGNPDSAYSFDGNDIITIAHNDILNSSNELSFSVWVKPNSQQNAMILGKSNYTTATNYLLRTKSTGFIQFEYKDFANSNSNPLLENDWNHIAVVSNADNSKQVYINGILATHTSDTSPYGLVTNPLTIGARPGAEFFNGSIDDLRIYKSALTETQVLSLFNNNTLGVVNAQPIENIGAYIYNNTLYFKEGQNVNNINRLSIYTIIGQNIYQNNRVDQNINLNFLDKGVYILKIELKNGSVSSKKFLIQ